MLYEQAIVGAFPLSSVVLASLQDIIINYLSKSEEQPDLVLMYLRGNTLVDNLFPLPVSTDLFPYLSCCFPLLVLCFSFLLCIKYWSPCLFVSEENDPESHSKSSTATIVAVVVVLVILLIVVVGIIVWRLRSPRNGMFWFILI